MASSSQARHGEEVNRFFKIIFHSTILDKKLMIPRKFIRKFGQQLLGCTCATLEVAIGDKWEVGLERDENGMVWFCNRGWERFVDFYSLDYGYFLRFEYKGRSYFSVVICHISIAEIAYPTVSFPASVGRAAARVQIEREDDSLFQEILFDVDADADEREEDGKSPMAPDSTPMRRLRSNPAGSASKATMKGTRLDDDDDAAQNRSGLKHLYFEIKIQPIFLNSRQQGSIPAWFTEEHSFMRDVDEVKLEVGDKVWPVRICLRLDKYVKLAAGWIRFAKENSLKLGDVCVFKLITTSPDVRMKVTIIRSGV